LSSRLLGNQRSAGLMIGRSRVGFALFEGTGLGQRVVRIDERTLDLQLFTGRPSEATAAALAQTLREVAPEAVRRYLPLHVSLPGAAVQMAVFPLDALPKKRAVQLDLARWHFTQAGNAEQALACDCESLGMDGDKHLLLGFAMDQAWHACIVDALGRAGMTAWSLNADVCRQFNRFHDRLCADKQGGALFAVTADAWSLLLWDELGRARHCSSRWRSGEETEGTRIAAEVERRILAYVQSLPGMRIEHLYAVADAQDEGLIDAIDARLREPCVRLRPETDGEPSTDESTSCRFAPIAAALQP
jgi:hypothetical protein